ncbi:MAG: hypothetical protein SVU32_00040 [Candidatus Nanohaloarchaea archaeon]|nr:hypothetical protein [Candidatus Nanohaloarchaea archaeon]
MIERVLVVVLVAIAVLAAGPVGFFQEDRVPGAALRDDLVRIEVWRNGDRTVINASDPGYRQIRDTGLRAIMGITGTRPDILVNCTSAVRDAGAVQFYFSREVAYNYGGYRFASDTFTLSTTTSTIYRGCTDAGRGRDTSPLLVSAADWLTPLRAQLERYGYAQPGG